MYSCQKLITICVYVLCEISACMNAFGISVSCTRGRDGDRNMSWDDSQWFNNRLIGSSKPRHMWAGLRYHVRSLQLEATSAAYAFNGVSSCAAINARNLELRLLTKEWYEPDSVIRPPSLPRVHDTDIPNAFMHALISQSTYTHIVISF